MTVRPEHRRRGHRMRLEWGAEGAVLLAAECAVVVVVDVLSFCTAVDVAVGRGAAVLPQRFDDAAAAAREAVAHGAVPASGRELVADGFGADLDLAAELDASTAVPELRAGFLVA